MAFRSIQDRWYVTDPATGKRVSSARHGQGMRYRARYKDAAGKEITRAFADKEKSKAQRWLDEVTASQVTGTYVDPKTARTTVGEWCETWLAGYATRRPRTVRQAQVHVAQIEAAFGPMPLSAVRPSEIRSWTVKLKADGLADSYVYALHSRLSQVMSDAVHDGLLARNPCSRRTSPGTGGQRPLRRHDRAGVGAARHGRRAPAPGDPVGGLCRAANRRGGGPAGRRRRLRAWRRAAGPAGQRGAAQERDVPHAASHPTGTGVGAIGRRGSLGRRVRRHRRPRSTDLDVGHRAGHPLRPAEDHRAAPSVPLPRPAALPGKPAHRQRPRRQGRPAPAPAWQRQDHARHLRTSLARQRRVRTGGCRCCAGCSWGLVGD